MTTTTNQMPYQGAPRWQVPQQIPVAYARSLHLCEYKLVLPLPEALKQRINSVKQQAAQLCPHPTAFRAPCNLALANFTTWDMMEAKLLPKLRTLAATTTPFSVRLHNYGSLPGRNVHIMASAGKPVTELLAALRGLQKLMKAGPDQTPYFAQAPQVVVATRLLPWQYDKLWQHFEKRQFNSSFVSNHLLLLKREPGTMPWQICERLTFDNQPHAVVQPSLFGRAA